MINNPFSQAPMADNRCFNRDGSKSLTQSQQRVAVSLLREWHTNARNKAALHHETLNFLRSLAE